MAEYFIEYSLTNRCNLNCAGCVSYSPLVKEEFTLTLEMIRKDFEKLLSVTNNGDEVDTIFITGGEPFLYKDIDKAILMITDLFRNIKIEIITNSTLFLKMSDDFLDLIKTHNVTLCISHYPINTEYEKIYSILDRIGIRYKKYGEMHVKDGKRGWFHQYLHNEYDEDFLKKRECRYGNEYSNIRILRNGKLYPCYQISYFEFFDNEFKGNHNMEVTSDDYIDLEKIHSHEELEKAIKKTSPPKFCRFCDGDKKEITDWSVSKKDISEWVKKKDIK